MSKTENSKFDLWYTRLSAIIPIITALTFIIGTLWANFFFQQFHINFFKVSGFSGAFYFLFSNIKVVALSLGIALFYYLFIVPAFLFLVFKAVELISNKFCSPPETNKLSAKSLPKPLIWIFGILIIGSIVYSISIFINLNTLKAADKAKFNVKTMKYEPVTIQYKTPKKMELKCVYQLGNIGNYSAYISKNRDKKSKEIQLITHLIKEDAITSMKYPFSYLKQSTEKARAKVIEKEWKNLCD